MMLHFDYTQMDLDHLINVTSEVNWLDYILLKGCKANRMNQFSLAQIQIKVHVISALNDGCGHGDFAKAWKII